MRTDTAVAVSGHREGRCVGPYHYHDSDIAERVVRLLVMTGFDVTVEQFRPDGEEAAAAPVGEGL